MTKAKFSTKFEITTIVVIVFVLIIFTPLVYKSLGGKNIYSNTENRILTQMPVFSWNPLKLIKIPEQIRAYYNDHFGLRDVLINARHHMMVEYLGVSPLPTVVIGKNGWLYLMETNDYDDFLGILPLPDDQLFGLQTEIIEYGSNLQQKNIGFYVLVAPDKETIYPENLPGVASSLNTRSRHFDFYERIEVPDYIKMVNVLESVTSAKINYPTYYSTDTHWNSYGAFIASQDVVQKMRLEYPEISDLTLSNYRVESRATNGKDIASMLGFVNMPDIQIDLKHLSESNISVKSEENKTVYTSQASNNLRLLVYGDSFRNAMGPFLAEAFSEVVLVAKDEPLDVWIERTHPDIVLYETVERYYFLKRDNPIWKVWAKEILAKWMK